MNTHSKSHKTNTPKPKTSATTLTLQPPKLLLPTIFSLISSTLLFAHIRLDLFSYHLRLPLLLTDILISVFTPLSTALALFLLHRLLEILIIHRAFRPAHLFSVLTIILSIAIFSGFGVIIFYLILYTLAGIIFAASLSFQKSHSLTTNPAHFLSSLLSIASTVIILSLINISILIPTALSTPNAALPSLLLSIVIITLLPLQLTLTFLIFTKLTPARSANLLPRFDFFVIIASLLFSLLSTVFYITVTEHNLSNTRFSHHQSTPYYIASLDSPRPNPLFHHKNPPHLLKNML